DREALTVGAPVGELNVVEDVAGCAARDRDAGQAATADERMELMAVQRDRHLPGLRDRKNLGGGEPERPRLGAFGAVDEGLERLALPAGRVDDGLAVGCEERGPDLSAAERDLAEGWRLDETGLLAGRVDEGRRDDCAQNRGEGKKTPGTARPLGRQC